jgi:prepilin-type N-terminal cleavage/methylation domain-containing protein
MWRKRGGCRESRAGFTLVEVIITTSIIGIISAMSIVSMSGFRVKREVEGNARIVAAAIREAQSDAVTGRNIRGTTCTLNSNTVACVPCEFQLSASGNTFTLSQSNASLSGGSCSPFADGKPVQLSNGVTISSPGVRFGVPRAEPREASGADLNSGSIDFVLSKGSVSVHVCVYPLGRVEERPVGSTGC